MTPLPLLASLKSQLQALICFTHVKVSARSS
jgi:hypothetical protein